MPTQLLVVGKTRSFVAVSAGLAANTLRSNTMVPLKHIRKVLFHAAPPLCLSHVVLGTWASVTNSWTHLPHHRFLDLSRSSFDSPSTRVVGNPGANHGTGIFISSSLSQPYPSQLDHTIAAASLVCVRLPSRYISPAISPPEACARYTSSY